MADIFNPDEIVTRSEHFVAGEWMTNNDEEIEVLRPSDREVQGMLCNGSDATVDQAVNAASLAFKNGWGTMAPRERAVLLRKWADLIDAHAEEIARLESSVSCRVYTEVVARDVRVHDLGVVHEPATLIVHDIGVHDLGVAHEETSAGAIAIQAVEAPPLSVAIPAGEAAPLSLETYSTRKSSTKKKRRSTRKWMARSNQSKACAARRSRRR